MFLNQLSQKEKEAFLSLSVHAANANGIFAAEEKILIQDYCKEMDIPSFDESSAMNMDQALEVFEESSIHIKRIVLLELLGLIFSDGEYDITEKQFVFQAAEKLNISKAEADELSKLIVKYLDILKEIAIAVD